jgi:hypothetical protein
MTAGKLGIRRGTNHRSGETLERRSGKPSETGIPGLGRAAAAGITVARRQEGLPLCLVEGLTAQQFTPSALYVRKGKQRGVGRLCW